MVLYNNVSQPVTRGPALSTA